MLHFPVHVSGWLVLLDAYLHATKKSDAPERLQQQPTRSPGAALQNESGKASFLALSCYAQNRTAEINC